MHLTVRGVEGNPPITDNFSPYKQVLRKCAQSCHMYPGLHTVKKIRECIEVAIWAQRSSYNYVFFSQSFLDLEYAFLEVKTEEPVKPRKENIDILSRKKIKIKKKKKRNKKMKQIMATELSTNSGTIAESKSELASLPESQTEPVLQNDVLPTFPDTPPSFDHVPCSKEIESPAWRHMKGAWSVNNAYTKYMYVHVNNGKLKRTDQTKAIVGESGGVFNFYRPKSCACQTSESSCRLTENLGSEQISLSNVSESFKLLWILALVWSRLKMKKRGFANEE